VKRPKLTTEQIKQTENASIAEGASWSVMYGCGEQYVTPYAIRLGASTSEIGIISTVPSFLGAIFQLLGAKIVDTYKTRKNPVIFFSILQSLTLLPLFLIPLYTDSVLWLTIIFTLYLIFSNLIAPGWNSWIGEVVPDKERARYFSKRNKITLTYMLVTIILSGILLNYYEGINIWIGFGILFTVAFIGRVVSIYYFYKHYEPEYIPTRDRSYTFKHFLAHINNNNFGHFIIYRSIMGLAVMIASPFFAVYMLKSVHFSYLQYSIIVLIPMIVKIFTFKYWGKYSDKFGNKNIMFISSFLVSIVPLAWFLTGYLIHEVSTIFVVLLFVEVITGFAWAGFELTTFNYVLETVPIDKRAKGIAYYNIIFGFTVLIGGLLGGWLIESNVISADTVANVLWIFLISAITRAIVTFYFYHTLKELVVKKHVDEKKLFYEMLIGKPLHSAMHQTRHMIFLVKDKTGMKR